MTAPVAGSKTSSEPPIAGRHCAPNRRPRHVDSIRILGIGAFMRVSSRQPAHCGFAAAYLLFLSFIHARASLERPDDRIQRPIGGQDYTPPQWAALGERVGAVALGSIRRHAMKPPRRRFLRLTAA